MLTAADYRKRSRKTITLPSGGDVEIRKLSGLDFLSAGEIPVAFQEAVRAKDKAAMEAVMKSDPGLTKRIDAAVLTSGVVSIKIVDKPPRDCAEDEISVHEISPEDSEFIVNEITSLNSLNAGAGKSIRRFPEEPGSPCDGGRDGQEVRETTDGDPVAGS